MDHHKETEMDESRMGRSRYEAYCLHWQPKYTFGGKLIQPPHKKMYKCWAWSEDEARNVIGRMMAKDGFGFGGVEGLVCTYEGTGGSYPKLPLQEQPEQKTARVQSKEAELRQEIASMKAMVQQLLAQRQK
jgi:hypothetical protein